MPRRRDDEDDFDDRPRRRPRDDDEEYDRPRRRRPAPSGGIPLGVTVGVGSALFCLVGVLLVLVVGADRRDNPPPPPEVAANPAAPPPAPAPRPAVIVPNIPGFAVKPPAFGLPPDPEAPAGPGVLLRGVGSDPNLLLFGGNAADGAVGVVSHRRTGVGYRIDVARTATGQAVGRVEIDTPSVNGYAVSPDGAWLAVIASAPGDGHPLAVYSVADGKRAGGLTPYPKGGPDRYKLPDLVWVAFLGPDKLLTVNESGGFDLWSVPGLKRVSGRLAGEPGIYTRLAADGWCHAPKNFALTPDGKTLAVLNGTGFGLFDTATGAETARTEPFTMPDSPASFYGAALRADGSRLACFCSLSASGQRVTAVAVWDAETGRRLSVGVPGGLLSGNGLAWCGPDHLAVGEAGGTAQVVRASTGEVVATVRTATGAKLGPVPPDDRLWAVTPGGLLDRTGAGPVLVPGELPAEFIPRTIFEIGPAGLVAK